jgi:general secretion pathway protein F
MPNYDYTGADKRGKKVKGTMEADSPKMLRQLLKQRGIYVTQIGAGRKSGQSILSAEVDFAELFEKVTPQDISIFTRQLATLVKARIPLTDSLAACVEQVDKPKLKKILVRIRSDVNEGVSFAQALDKYRDVFGPLYSSMVRSGEASGTLDAVLVRLAEFSEASVKLRQSISSAMMYPLIMISVGSLILTGLFIFVIPQITQIFADTGQVLPLVTRIIIGISHFLQDYAILVVFMLGAMYWLFKRYIKKDSGRRKWDKVKLKIPVFGELFLLVDLSRFTKTLATLLKSGVPLLTALDITKNVLGNQILLESVEDARVAVKEGHALATPLKESGRFPPMLVHMISVGERSGALEEMLGVVAETYENQVENKVSRLTTLLEPLMIVFMGATIGVIVFAVLMPILQMNEFVQ